MTTKRPRANVTFHPELFHELETASANTGLSVSHIVDQLLGAHMEELIEFNQWIERQDADSDARAMAVHALEVYGPNDLMTEMKRLDPAYQPQSERLLAQVSRGGLDGDELADLRAMLAAWKAKQAAKGTEQ